MTVKRLILPTLLIIGVLVWWLLARTNRWVSIPVPLVQAAVLNAYELPALAPYKLLNEAVAVNDYQTLGTLAFADNSYAAYRAALLLARNPAIGGLEQLRYYQRVLALRIDDPLDKLQKQALLIEAATVAETAGQTADALTFYKQALPNEAAIAGLQRLQGDPYRLANSLLNARANRAALAALAGRAAPSIEAPAYAALYDNEAALDAYERWLAEIPGSAEALYGKAKILYRLGDYEAADAIFSQFDTAGAAYWRGLIAQQQGDTTRAVALLRQSGDASDLWLASGFLEAEDRYSEALPVYLELAGGSSSLSDDAAYRAFVLASRLGDTTTAQTASDYLPANSFFGVKAGKAFALSQTTTLPPVVPPAVPLASALLSVNDIEAARGELLFALRAATDTAEKVALAEDLQRLGEYRQSQRAAVSLLSAGQTDARVWRLAYPQAYPQYVTAEAVRFGVEPELVWAIMRQESAFFERALSSSNAQGLMQVIPSTWDWLAELQGEAPANPFDPAANIRYGAFYLNWLSSYFSAYNGDPELIIASYNRGQGYIRRLFEGEVVAGDKNELYREIDALETREYLQKVWMNYLTYKELY